MVVIRNDAGSLIHPEDPMFQTMLRIASIKLHGGMTEQIGAE